MSGEKFPTASIIHQGIFSFTLKDRGGAIACVMFAGSRKGLNFRMSEGMAVIVYGSVSVYERDGKYQLYAREIIQEGAGRLYEAYEALKEKAFCRRPV